MKARLPQGYGGGGAGNMNQLARQAQEMQEKMAVMSEELDAKEYSASAGGNAVTVTVLGAGEIQSIDIKPEVVDPEDIEILSDMIMAAANEALRQAAADKESRMNSITGGFNMPGLF